MARVSVVGNQGEKREHGRLLGAQSASAGVDKEMSLQQGNGWLGESGPCVCDSDKHGGSMATHA